MGKNYWMVVDSPENFEITKNLGFTVYGVGPKFRRRAQRMQPEDHILFYVYSLRKWTATAIIKSSYFTDQAPIWQPDHSGEKYPYRVKLEPDIVLDEENYIDALLLAPRLEYVKRWAPEDWPLAFLDKLHLIPQKDYRLIEDEMKRLQGKHNLSHHRHKNRRHFPNRKLRDLSEPEASGDAFDEEEDPQWHDSPRPEVSDDPVDAADQAEDREWHDSPESDASDHPIDEEQEENQSATDDSSTDST